MIGRRANRVARVSTWALVLGLAGLTFFLGCAHEAEWIPGPEETSTRFLREEVEEALAAVEDAAALMGKDPAAAGRALDEARRSLDALRAYYLPLLEARSSAYNALRWYHIGDQRRSLGALTEIESILLQISDQQDPQLSRETDDLLDLVVEASAAVRAGRADAPNLLETLGSRINLMLFRGGLALHGTHLEAR